MINFTRTFPLILLLALLTPAFGGETAKPVFGAPQIKYEVLQGTVTVVSALTPYDSDETGREAFLKWFKRGFETVLQGNPPLMIEWLDSPEGRAGRSGYDSGMDEAERYLKGKERQ